MTWLTVPGLGSSGPDHWQTRWERLRPCCRRAELGDWDDPDLERWIALLALAVRRAGPAPVLVAHSLGCLAVAWWASRARHEAGQVAAALLVAPPDVERAGADARLRRFAPAPSGALPFPALLVASQDDPYASFDASTTLATRWSARLHDAGTVGHLNAASGLGDWCEGQRMVERLLAQPR